jgi:AcrR family transcriptional regulator
VLSFVAIDLDSGHGEGMTSQISASQNPAPSARARVRAEITREILDAARRQLAEAGSAGLSLRAVAREVGMVSSAVYRYFPSRDVLITTLIVDAYAAIATAAEQAEAAVPRPDYGGRWLTASRAVRGWALAHPHEYALIFGSPVPGYQAPDDTIDPAARLPLLMVQILVEAGAAGHAPPPGGPALPGSVQADLTALRRTMAPTLTEPQLARAVLAWTELIGSISFEMFGHLNNTIHDYAGYFDYQMLHIAAALGLPAPMPPGPGT